jgi:lysophospholipase L1-like esterase
MGNVFRTSRHILACLLLGIFICFSCKKRLSDIPDPTMAIPTPTPIDTSMVVVKADNPLIHYMGRIDYTIATAPVYSYPGVTIKATFSGPAIDVIIKDYGTGGTTTTNYYAVLIDGLVQSPLRVNSTDTLYLLARNLTDANHTIELVKRTEASVGRSSFKGFRLRTGNTLLTATALPTRKIEFIGNSLTCGYGNELSIAGPPSGNPNTGFHSVNENNYKAWGAITCRTLNAQYMCTAYSGRGLYRNNTGSTTGTLPLIYDRIHPDLTAPLWTLSNYTPDVIVISLGTNDLAPEAWGVASPLDSASFVNTYISFIQTLRSNNANAEIICVVSNALSDFYPAGMKWKTRMTNYIQAVDDYFVLDTKVHKLVLNTQNSPYGEDYHPSALEHQNMANQLVPLIQTVTGW